MDDVVDVSLATPRLLVWRPPPPQGHGPTADASGVDAHGHAGGGCGSKDGGSTRLAGGGAARFQAPTLRLVPPSPPPPTSPVRLTARPLPPPPLARHGVHPPDGRAGRGAVGVPTAAAGVVVTPLPPLRPRPPCSSNPRPTVRTDSGGGGGSGSRATASGERPRPGAACRRRPACLGGHRRAAALADWRPPHGKTGYSHTDAGQTPPPPPPAGGLIPQLWRAEAPSLRPSAVDADPTHRAWLERVRPTVLILTMQAAGELEYSLGLGQ